MIDTHCHLNFSRLIKKASVLIDEAQRAGVDGFIVPGTDIQTSRTAVELSEDHKTVYAAVGIHPHHVYEIYQEKSPEHITDRLSSQFSHLENLLIEPGKIVALGEVGLDRHQYIETKYEDYANTEGFFELQETVFRRQLTLALRFKKSIIVHNRESTSQLLSILKHDWKDEFASRMVFHCCEPNEQLLQFAQERQIFIGIDGDVTYNSDKASFVQRIPIELLVLETDSPYLLPEPLRTQKTYPNTPAYLPIIAEAVAKICGRSVEDVIVHTTRNARKLFRLPND